VTLTVRELGLTSDDCASRGEATSKVSSAVRFIENSS
jgi:hypothetical protein